LRVNVNACEAENAPVVLWLPLVAVEAAMLTLQVPALANELPVSVIVALKTPEFEMLPGPNDGVTPAGKPLIAMPIPVTFSPPTGVTLIVICPEPECVIDSDVAPSPIVIPCACCTCTVTVFVAVTPSPIAITVTGVELTVAVAAAESVNVVVPFPFVSEIPFAPHDAVTPLGKPLTLIVTAPVNVPFPVKVIASVTVLPCTTLIVLEAGVSESVGGVNETVNGKLAVAVTTEPLFGAIFAVSPSVADPAAAAELPVSVKVHATPPAVVNDAELQLAVTPLGSPEATLMLDPPAPLATAAPPAGVAVTVTVVEPSDCIEADAGEAARVKFGACATTSVNLLVAVRPSPPAVTVSAALPTDVDAPASSVNVALVLADPDAGLTGFADQLAVTPLGNPLRLRLTLPVNDPPVPTVKLTGPFVPCVTVTVLAPAVSVSVGGALTVST
jgi:hypothetical protein